MHSKIYKRPVLIETVGSEKGKREKRKVSKCVLIDSVASGVEKKKRSKN